MKIKLNLVLFGLLTSMFISSCQYKFVEPEVVTPPDPNVEVKFSTQILPIFNTNGNCSSCHRAGATAPDLTDANAYTSIYAKNLVDTLNPGNSKLHFFIAPTATTHTWKHYTANQANLVLLWIQQGGKNN